MANLKYALFFSIFFLPLGCVKDEPGFAEYNVGVGHFKAGEFKKAAEYFQEAVELNPRFAEAYMNLGTSLYQLESYRESLYAYEKADSLFRSGEFVEIRGTDHREKLEALREMTEIARAQVMLLDRDSLSEEKVKELNEKIKPSENI